mgnify:CR=1 FL=1
MFKTFTILFSLITFQSLAQVVLEANNTRATFYGEGSLFLDSTNFGTGYEFPKDSSTSVIYSAGIWVAALDQDSSLHAAISLFSSDWSKGPISDDYNSSYYISTFTQPFKITRDQVNYHVANYTAAGYIPDPAIANWPGNGNTSEGVAAQLAPYVDVNNDQIYDPMDGDHPYFQGDEAVLIIFNDEANPHLASGGEKIGVEMHLLFYQFQDADQDVNNTTFLNAKLFNRRDTNYIAIHFGFWTDFDIGLAQNDFVGSDSLRSMVYGYNGTSSEGGPGTFASNPPACGIKFLNHQANGALYHNIGGGTTGDPNNAGDYYNYLNNKWQNGQPTMYGGNGFNTSTGGPTNWMFGSMPNDTTGWSEVTEMNPVGDRRMLLSSSEQVFNAGDEICFDMALLVNNEANDYIGNAVALYGTADNIQSFYDNSIQQCSQIFLSNEKYEDLDVKVYPNPNQGIFTIQSSEIFDYVIYNLKGQIIQQGKNMVQNTLINLDIESGIYILQVTSGNKVKQHKIQIIK